LKLFVNEKIEVRDSNLSGRGVFANEDIRSGEILEECHHVILDNKFKFQDPMLQTYIFSWPKGSFGGNNASSVVLGMGSIFNHSDDNNADWVTDEIRNLYSFYAIKDIKKDEEIFTNYGKLYKDVVGTNNK
jgi:SET domain-containing protein